MEARSMVRESYEELIKDIEHSQAGSETWENARIKIQVKLMQDLVLTISSQLNKGFDDLKRTIFKLSGRVDYLID